MRHLIVLPLILCLPGALCAATLRASDGLTLELADDGQVAGLSLLGRPVPVTPGGGFYVAEAGATGPDEGRHPLRCPILPDSGMFIQKQRFDDLIHEVQSSNLSDKAKAYIVPLLEDEADREQQALILFGQGDTE